MYYTLETALKYSLIDFLVAAYKASKGITIFSPQPSLDHSKDSQSLHISIEEKKEDSGKKTEKGEGGGGKNSSSHLIQM